MQNAYYASDQVTAVFLAQEALESVRKYRDAKALLAYNSPVGTVDTADWLPTTLCGTSGGCIFKTSVSVPFVPCPTTSSCDVVYLDSSDVYNQKEMEQQQNFIVGYTLMIHLLQQREV